MNLSFHKFNKKLNEKRYQINYKNLSIKMRNAVQDVYDTINETHDPIVAKIDGIIKDVAKNHDVKVSDIENYFDNELIK